MATWLDRSTARDYGVYDRLLNRQLGDRSRHSQIRGIYGDKQWIRNLDIVNELSGHTGCVNALSWSKSGSLLASGSDDQHLNIHRYQPDNANSYFKLTTSISTGHSANIFSVKFMPHSNDRTLVTCAGDRQVRIFDLEYAGRTPASGDLDSLSRRRVHEHVRGDVQYLGQGDTNAKVFRSHGDRVKRIVTESSPYFFLTCSEDGEVRQWDLRQPSATYPAPRRGRLYRQGTDTDDDDLPPPLISYKRFQLDLNTISCSPSQPHYIALGGAHLHCFLHDRRMLGRDKSLEKGSSASSGHSEHDDDLMGEATKCVRKFAPNGKGTMGGGDSGHITACKISDANPNEMIASWSGDWIYSFDLLRSPDASEMPNQNAQQEPRRKSNRLKAYADRKRKRDKTGSTTSQDVVTRGSSKARRTQTLTTENPEVAIRVHYDNGQIEHIPVTAPNPEIGEGRVVSDTERESSRIAVTTLKIRKHLFSPSEARAIHDNDPTSHAASFTSALGFAASLLPDMDEMSRTWRYPLNPTGVDVAFQDLLRRSRESARRFTQACGTVARLLGGKLHTAGRTDSIAQYAMIQPAPNEKPIVNSGEQFSYDFLKAIIVWLDSGPGALLEAFTNPNGPARPNPRLPIPPDSPIEAIDEILIPYLSQIASRRPIINVDASRFETNSNREVFESELAALVAFSRAVKIPFEDLSSATAQLSSSTSNSVINISTDLTSQDRKTALRFWGLKVCRGVLLNAGEEVDVSSVSRAFGGLGHTPGDNLLREEHLLQQQFEDINATEEERQITHIGGASRHNAEAVIEDEAISQNSISSQSNGESPEDDDDAMISVDDIAAAILGRAETADDDGEYNDDGDDDDDDDDTNDEAEDHHQDAELHGDETTDDDDAAEDGDGASARHFLYRSVLSRSSLRARVQPNVPCSEHTRSYRGHCNVKTVKDVNFYGLNDEYIVSGSDSGHLFIWDKRSSQLVNILEGDGEVVNVVQGHPYEPMLAVSGIDHTIKIFSSDAIARHHAKTGSGVSAADDSGWSSIRRNRLRFGGTRPSRTRTASQADGSSSSSQNQSLTKHGADHPAVLNEPDFPGGGDEDSDTDADEDPATVAPTGLHSRRRMKKEYEITSQNDVERRGGNREAFLTHSMLAQLAVQLQAQRAAVAAQGQGENEGAAGIGLEEALSGDGPIVLSDDCSVM